MSLIITEPRRQTSRNDLNSTLCPLAMRTVLGELSRAIVTGQTMCYKSGQIMCS